MLNIADHIKSFGYRDLEQMEYEQWRRELFSQLQTSPKGRVVPFFFE